MLYYEARIGRSDFKGCIYLARQGIPLIVCSFRFPQIRPKPKIQTQRNGNRPKCEPKNVLEASVGLREAWQKQGMLGCTSLTALPCLRAHVLFAALWMWAFLGSVRRWVGGGSQGVGFLAFIFPKSMALRLYLFVYLQKNLRS